MPHVVFPTIDVGRCGWRCCEGLVEVVQAHRPEEVLPALSAVQQAANDGLFAAGFIAYEAAAGLDEHFAVYPSWTEAHPREGLAAVPLVWFGLFRRMAERDRPDCASAGGFTLGEWRADVTTEQYAWAIDRIRRYIAAGDTYQVNYTYRLRTDFRGEPWPLFDRLLRSQLSPHGAYVDTGRHVICSASPELFFSLSGGLLTSRPMKGTAARGRTTDEDRRRRASLSESPKDRAENAMIVDMMRNDIGRIACLRSIRVCDVFTVEKYPTVFQMTSTVTARTDATFVEIIQAMFPCASITGAPKIRTMQIIRELEAAPRGVYTGCVGYVAPGGEARFNVAIRTAVVDRITGSAEYGVGGGIVWDSSSEGEYQECLTKAAVLTAEPVEFKLLETLQLEDRRYFLLKEHLHRLTESAEYFDFRLDLVKVCARLEALAAGVGRGPWRVRLLLDAAGGVLLEHQPLGATLSPYRLRLARRPVDPRRQRLYHKTTDRSMYEQLRGEVAHCDDVVLWNSQGQATETSIANLVIRKDGRLVTPPVECGLLGGVFREHLLAAGEVAEEPITLDDLSAARELFAINSVRKWIPAVLVG